MGTIGLYKLNDALVQQCNTQFHKIGITLGRRIGIDSTPLPAMYKDDDAKINGHYYETQGIGKMYKIHIAWCLDTGTPLVIFTSDGLAYDGHFLRPILGKLKSLRINFEEFYADNHYGSYENWATTCVEYGAKAYYTLSTTAKHNKKGTGAEIQRAYNELRNEPDWVRLDKIDVIGMMRFLMKCGHHEYVGAYFRNQWMQLWNDNKVQAKRLKNFRSGAERMNSILKDQLDMDKLVTVKGQKNIQKYAIQFFIALLGIILTRLQNGVREGFVKINKSAFY